MNFTEKTILITSGPTFAPIDAVRSITNRSTGRLGSAIAYHLCQFGANVILLAGETSMTPLDCYSGFQSNNLSIQKFYTVEELKNLIMSNLRQKKIDAVLMAAAVLDYIPVVHETGKHKSDRDEWTIPLKRGEKIIESIKSWSPESILVGFKLETKISLEELIRQAGNLIERSRSDFVVANRLEEIDSNRHVAYLIEPGEQPGGYRSSNPLYTRDDISLAIARKLDERWFGKIKEADGET